MAAAAPPLSERRDVDVDVDDLRCVAPVEPRRRRRVGVDAAVAGEVDGDPIRRGSDRRTDRAVSGCRVVWRG